MATDAERAQRKLDEGQTGKGPDLVLDEHAFTYVWRGNVYGVNIMDVLTALDMTPERMKGLNTDEEKAFAERIRELAAMPEDLPIDHVLTVCVSAMRKAQSLGKDLQPAPTS